MIDYVKAKYPQRDNQYRQIDLKMNEGSKKIRKNSKMAIS